MVEWADRLRHWSVAEVAEALSALPPELQERLEPSFAKKKPPPWDMASGTVSGLLSELELSDLYEETFTEYEYERVGDLTAIGRDGWDASLRDLGVTRDHRDRIAALAFSERPLGTCGGCFDAGFLNAIRPAWAATMGCENMGVLLYAMCRFVKPRAVLEVGAGITSLWLLQALRDNHEELKRCDAALAGDGYRVGAPSPGAEWMAGDELRARAAVRPLLHCVDNMAHAHTTAHRVVDAAAELKLSEHLVLHEADAYALAAESSEPLDLIWLDFGIGIGGRLDSFLTAWWPRLRAGGLLIVHSTLTNAVTRHWLEKMRARVGGGESASAGDAMRDEFRELSFLEPHKMFQNSCSCFQKRPEGYAEPVLTSYP